MNNGFSGVLSVLVFLFIVFIVGGILVSQFVGTLGDLADARDQVEVFSGKLEDVLKENKQLKSDLTTEQEAHKADEQARQVAEQSAAACTSDLTLAIGDRDRISALLATVTNERDGLRGQVTGLTAERDGLVQQVGKVSGERDILVRQVDGLNKQVAERTAERDTLNTQLQTVTTALTTVTTERDALVKQVNDPSRVPVTGKAGTEQAVPAVKIVPQPWWLLTIPLVVVSFAAIEVFRVQGKHRKTARPQNAGDKVQVSMTRPQLDAFIRWQRSQKK